MNRGSVSIVKGKVQAPALRFIGATAWSLALIGALSDHPVSAGTGLIAVSMIAVTPLLRVGWLIYRWRQERDTLFVVAGSALLAIIAIAGLIAFVAR
jgi:hypothetical protein